MISVIICSISKDFAIQVQSNIASTIGVPWESVIIDNSITAMPITKVYNLGASKSKYDILCFVHEDVLFETDNWGIKIVESFNFDKQLGLIGVGGSKYKSKIPSGWFCGFPELDCCNITHLDKTGKREVLYMNPAANVSVQDVVVVDGVFMCCPRNVWEEIKFDEILLTDFHLYDIDFSIRVSEKYKSVITFEINILHIVKGNHYGNKWLESTLKWHKHFKKRLPVFTSYKNAEKKNGFESGVVCTWLIRLKHENLSFKNKLRWLFATRIWRFFLAWPYIPFFLFRSIFKNR
jgi:Glycosyltransferase like family